jgi:hypothetical protein
VDVSPDNLEYSFGMGELADTCNDAGGGRRAGGVGALGTIKGIAGSAAGAVREEAMRWKEVMPGEVFNERRFVSRPNGKWEGGIRRLEFGKHLVGISPWSWNYVFSYMCGDLEEAQLLCGFVLGMSWWIEEEISEGALVQVFPEQGDKEADREFWEALFLARDRLFKGSWGEGR